MSTATTAGSFLARPTAGGVHGRIRVPGDKSISHRALLLAARAEGRSVIRGLSAGEDVRHTLEAVRQFGVALEPGPAGEVVVEGGADRLSEPGAPIDVGNSGTAIRLLAGWAAAMDGLTVLTGDASVARRPMDRVVAPLRAMGATVDGRRDGLLPPLVVRGGRLHGIDYRPPVASAQVKSAILLAGLAADGATTVREAVPTRAHTEELLELCGARVERQPGAVTVWASPLRPLDFDVPGDPSQAAFWIVAACITPGSSIVLDQIYVGEGRAGFLDVLERMGADVTLSDRDDRAATATVSARFAPLRATDIEGAEVPSLIDEIPVLAVAAACAEGTTTIAGAAELRVKESDRIASMVAALGAVGATAAGRPDGLVIEGQAGRPLEGGRVEAAGDHRVAMSMAVAALAAGGPVEIDGWDSVATSYPSFEEDYERCRTR